ncbi:TadE/TadG family type IV pilus assembly protein [Vibrio paucivorans]
MSFPTIQSPRKQSGLAAVEMTIVVPFLLIILVGVVELTQLVRANHILLSLSREGANIISRSSTEEPQDVMDIISVTSQPLVLDSDGIIYINLVVGQEDDDPYLSEQHRWGDYGYDKESAIWSHCESWDIQEQCEIEDGDNPTLADFPMELSDGESVYVVEVFYRYTPFFNLVFDSAITIQDATYL